MATETAPSSDPSSALARQAPRGWSCETGFVSDLLLRCGHRDDQGALALLYDVLSPVVTAAVSTSVDAPRVGDCVRDVFVQVWRDAPGYRAGPVSSVEWILDRVATVSSRRSPARDLPRGLADTG